MGDIDLSIRPASSVAADEPRCKKDPLRTVLVPTWLDLARAAEVGQRTANSGSGKLTFPLKRRPRKRIPESRLPPPVNHPRLGFRAVG